MEHDLRKILAQKIREAEQRPAAWNKDATWQKLHAQLPRPKKSAPYLRYAAVLAILILFGVSLIQLRGTKQNEPIARRMKEGASTKEGATTEQPKVSSQEEHELSRSRSMPKKDQQQNTIRKMKTQPVVESTPVITQETTMLRDILPSLPKDSVIVPQQREKSTVAVTRIEPIIGTYVAEEKAPLARRKKTRVYIFDSQDDRPTEERDRNPVLARIK